MKLSPADVEQIMKTYSPVTQNRVPDVVAELRDQVPAGPFLASDALDRDFAGAGWWTKVFMLPEQNTLIFVAKGE
ncbi:hypothetical protein [Gordonia sp. (in: high G+C Gram-positive bacteria)]|uniref:hypothetical protein n=1 Tax=Gordonia sp. (in: high G+C Gram-positive bacteria) TaxID=84139 RepID=UPI003C76100D